jgi:hypothetical protein
MAFHSPPGGQDEDSSPSSAHGMVSCACVGWLACALPLPSGRADRRLQGGPSHVQQGEAAHDDCCRGSKESICCLVLLRLMQLIFGGWKVNVTLSE